MLAAVNLKPHEGEVFWEPEKGDFGSEKRAENAAENRHEGPRKRREQTPRRNKRLRKRSAWTLCGFRSRTKANLLSDGVLSVS